MLNALLGWMEIASVPGLGMAVVEDGELAWARSFGVVSAGTGVPVGDGTVFELASLGKPVFAYVVLQLVDEERIELDRPLVEYYRPKYLPRHPQLDFVTARDVMRHSSGLPNWRRRSTDELVPAFEPGTGWRYSGEGYVWLQLVVEQITGQSLEELVQARLFGPAGMTRTTYVWNDDFSRWSVYGHHDPGDGEGTLAEQHSRERWTYALRVARRMNRPLSAWRYDDAVKALPEAIADTREGLFRWPHHIMANAASSLRATLSDYARFAALSLPRRRRHPWEISKAAQQAMTSRQIIRRQNAIYWGLGWELEPRAGGLTFAHHGNNGDIFTSFVFGDPAHRRALVIATNSGGGPAVYRRIIRQVTGEDLYQFMV